MLFSQFSTLALALTALATSAGASSIRQVRLNNHAHLAHRSNDHDHTSYTGVCGTQNHMMPLSALLERVKPTSPRLYAIGGNLIQASGMNDLPPQVLFAIAMIESQGGADAEAYANKAGMFQFTSDETWEVYGEKGNRLNDRDAAWAAARYIADLCRKHDGNLWDALREYNGTSTLGDVGACGGVSG